MIRTAFSTADIDRIQKTYFDHFGKTAEDSVMPKVKDLVSMENNAAVFDPNRENHLEPDDIFKSRQQKGNAGEKPTFSNSAIDEMFAPLNNKGNPLDLYNFAIANMRILNSLLSYLATQDSAKISAQYWLNYFGADGSPESLFERMHRTYDVVRNRMEYAEGVSRERNAFRDQYMSSLLYNPYWKKYPGDFRAALNQVAARDGKLAQLMTEAQNSLFAEETKRMEAERAAQERTAQEARAAEERAAQEARDAMERAAQEARDAQEKAAAAEAERKKYTIPDFTPDILADILKGATETGQMSDLRKSLSALEDGAYAILNRCLARTNSVLAAMPDTQRNILARIELARPKPEPVKPKPSFLKAIARELFELPDEPVAKESDPREKIATVNAAIAQSATAIDGAPDLLHVANREANSTAQKMKSYGNIVYAYLQSDAGKALAEEDPILSDVLTKTSIDMLRCAALGEWIKGVSQDVALGVPDIAESLTQAANRQGVAPEEQYKATIEAMSALNTQLGSRMEAYDKVPDIQLEVNVATLKEYLQTMKQQGRQFDQARTQSTVMQAAAPAPGF